MDHAWRIRLRKTSFFASGVAVCLALFAPGAYGQGDIPEHLHAIDNLILEAFELSQAAESALSVQAIKEHADAVFSLVWGQRSGLSGHTRGAAAIHGWKTRWQTSGEDFDEDHVARHGAAPPKIGDPAALGIVGRSRHVRRALQSLLDEKPGDLPHVTHVISSINNVIGWTRLDDGVTKAELQPRVWNAPSQFWNSAADTGWLHEVFAQAVNILKTDYEGDIAMARAHAAAMTGLILKCRSGVNADGDGSIGPVMMEGGIATAIAHARYGGLLR